MSLPESIAIRDLRNDVSSIIKRVEAGESLNVTRHGQLVARLVPATDQRQPRAFSELLQLRRRVPADPEFAREIREHRDLDLARDPYGDAQ